MRVFEEIRRLPVLLALAVLSACGGSGTPSAPTGPVTTPGSGGISVTASKGALVFRGFAGGYSPVDNIEFTLTGALPSDTYYVGATSDSNRFDAEVLFRGSTASATLRAAVTSQPLDKSGAIRFNLCKDSACANVVWSQTIPYTLKTVEVTPASLNLRASEGQDAEAITLVANPAVGKELAAAAPAGQNWLTVTQGSDGVLRVGASAKGLTPGVYQDNVTLSFAGMANSQTQTVPVTFTVGGGAILAGTQPVDVTSNTAQSVLTGGGALNFNSGSPAWVASSDQPWLQLTASSGTGNGSLGWRIDLSKLGISNWSSTSANIVVRATGLSPATFPVVVNLRLPDLYAVSETLAPGVAGSVTVQGKGFSQLSGVGAFRIDGRAVTGGTIVSDGQAVLNLPALSSGAHSLSIANASGLVSLSATVNVGVATANTYALVNSPSNGDKSSSRYDAVRNAVFSIDRTNQLLIRMRKSGQSWQMATLAVPEAGDLALAPDHGTVYITSGSGKLLAVDPDRLVVRATYTTAQLRASVQAPDAVSLLGRGTGLTVTNNGRIWFEGSGSRYLMYFDINAQEFKTLPASGSTTPWAFDGIQLAAPANGAYFVLMRSSEWRSNYRYTSATGEFAFYYPAESWVSHEYAISADGRLIVSNNFTLIDAANNTVIGKLPATDQLTVSTLLAPDGSRIYRMIGSNSKGDYIEVIDSATLTLLGTIPVPEREVLCWFGGTPGCYAASFSISADGTTLFLSGRDKSMVLPIPKM